MTPMLHNTEPTRRTHKKRRQGCWGGSGKKVGVGLLKGQNERGDGKGKKFKRAWGQEARTKRCERQIHGTHQVFFHTDPGRGKNCKKRKSCKKKGLSPRGGQLGGQAVSTRKKSCVPPFFEKTKPTNAKNKPKKNHSRTEGQIREKGKKRNSAGLVSSNWGKKGLQGTQGGSTRKEKGKKKVFPFGGRRKKSVSQRLNRNKPAERAQNFRGRQHGKLGKCFVNSVFDRSGTCKKKDANEVFQRPTRTKWGVGGDTLAMGFSKKK